MYKNLEELVCLYKAGVKEAGEELIERVRPLILNRVGLNFQKRGDEWEDLVQRAYVIALECAGKYNSDKGVPYIAFLNKALYYGLYSRKAESAASLNTESCEGLEFIETLEDQSDSALDTVIKKQELSSLYNALSALPQNYRKVLICKFFKGMTLKEYAEREGISYMTAFSHKSKALAMLEKILNKIHFTI